MPQVGRNRCAAEPYGSFTRSFTLPDGADLEHAKSELKEGVLVLVIPKMAGAQTKKIRSRPPAPSRDGRIT